MNKQIIIYGAIFGLLTVVFGAFGAHALDSLLIENGRLDVYETAVRYQGLHAIVLIVIGAIYNKLETKWCRFSCYSFIFGILIFSGSLYALSISNTSFLGAITPFGGLSLILGWSFLIIAVVRSK